MKINLNLFIPRQCLSICCSRSHDAASRLGNTPVGLLPLACSATGTGIRARILALQLLTMACDKNALGDHVPKASQNGHQAVSESLSTLRLRCAEPVRFRLLIGILNSGGGSGELQFVGMRFLNTLMESAETLQTRLYLQAELFQAGLEPPQMSKLISSTSPWMQKLLDEVKKWESIKVDIERLQKEVRSAEQCRSKMVILERKVETLQEEKNVFTSIERRLQEKCADLQRELMNLKKNSSTASTLEKRPVALPRQTISGNTLKKNNSENEDEGISSSETGQSSSPVPPNDYPAKHKSDKLKNLRRSESYDDDSNTTIDDVIEELTNIVNDAEREIKESQNNKSKPLTKSKSEDLLTVGIESEIVVNLLPQPPRKSNKSLVHIFGPQHEVDGSDYDLYYVENNQQKPQKESLYENDYELENNMENNHQSQLNHPDIINTTQCVGKNSNGRQTDDNNRQLLNVIMDAREKEQQKANAAFMSRAHSTERDIFPTQQFNGGVFFMSDMMNHSKFSKPDIMAAIEAKRGSKNIGIDSMIDVVISTEQKPFHQAKPRQIFLPTNDKFSPPQNVAFNNFKFKNTNVNPTLFDQLQQQQQQQQAMRENRAQSNNGSKVTDLISGLY